MASVSKRKNMYYVRVYIRGEQVCFYGFSDKRDAERAGEKIDALVALSTTVDGLDSKPTSLKTWEKKLAESNPKVYEKLAAYGLVDQIEKYTLEDLIVRHRASLVNVTDATKEVYEKPAKNLRDFFGADCQLEKITPSRADEFYTWLRTEPLHERRKEKVPYSKTTANKRIEYAKQLFRYAKKIRWVAENPFADIEGGSSSNPEKWEYVDAETVMRLIDATYDPKWRTLYAMVRFAGVQSSSEVYHDVGRCSLEQCRRAGIPDYQCGKEQAVWPSFAVCSHAPGCRAGAKHTF